AQTPPQPAAPGGGAAGAGRCSLPLPLHGNGAGGVDAAALVRSSFVHLCHFRPPFSRTCACKSSARNTCVLTNVFTAFIFVRMDVNKEAVRAKYAEAARSTTSCCSPVTRDLYGSEAEGLPAEALLASLGCGNPTLLAHLHEGESVLDLGSGGGIDVPLSARRIGPSGKAYGLDMTDEMLALANENKRKAGVDNVEFLKGEIENIPLPDAAVDVII